MRTGVVLRPLAALGVVAMLLAACSDDDESSTSTAAANGTDGGSSVPTEPADSSATTAAPPATAEGSADTSGSAETTTGSTAAEPEGEPIRFVVPAAVGGIAGFPESFDGAQAATDAINAAGGIPDPAGGPNRPLEMLRCEVELSAQYNPDAALNCAQDSISQGVVAVVARYLTGPDGTAAWTAADVPMIGTIQIDSDDFVNDHVFPIFAAGPVLAGAMAVALQEAGAQTIGFVTGDTEGGRVLPQFVEPVLDTPEDLTDEVYMSLDPSADYTAQISQLASADPDGIVVLGSNDMNVRIISGLRSAGYSGLISVPGSTLQGGDSLETLGEAAEGLLTTTGFVPLDSDVEQMVQFNEEMDAYDPDATRSDATVNAWSSVHLLAEILAEVGTADAASVTAALAQRPVDLGVTPPFTMGVADNPYGIPRIFSSKFRVVEISDGESVPFGDGEFLDLNDFAAG